MVDWCGLSGSRLGRRSSCRPLLGRWCAPLGAWLQNESMERPLSESKGRGVRSWASDVVRWLNGEAFQDRVWAGDFLVGCHRGRRCGARTRVWCETHSSRVRLGSVGSEVRARLEATDGSGGGADGRSGIGGGPVVLVSAARSLLRAGDSRCDREVGVPSGWPLLQSPLLLSYIG